jgi:hypothetical protein
MGQIAKRVEDKRLLKLIRAFLNAEMENGLVSPSVEELRQEVHFRHCCPTSCSTNSTESLNVVATATCATRMIVCHEHERLKG